MEFSAEVNFSTGHIAASGSESFIMGVLAWAKEHKESFATAPLSEVRKVSLADGVHEASQEPPTKATGIAAYSDLFAERGDDVAIIADTAKGTIADTARHTTLLYLYGRKLIGKTETSDDEIRKLCEEHACYDSKNFSAHMKGLKGKVIQEGSSRSFTARLTTPGERTAKAIADKIQDDANNS